jgi:hypothetical protein
VYRNEYRNEKRETRKEIGEPQSFLCSLLLDGNRLFGASAHRLASLLLKPFGNLSHDYLRVAVFVAQPKKLRRHAVAQRVTLALVGIDAYSHELPEEKRSEGREVREKRWRKDKLARGAIALFFLPALSLSLLISHFSLSQ